MKFCLCLILSMILFTSCTANDAEGDTKRIFTGDTLLEMGRLFNKPLLRLIGKTLNNLDPCAEWSEWSPCKRFVGQYGAKRRERDCSKGAGRYSGSKATAGAKPELESQICQDYCPSKYELSSNGICLYFQNTTKKTKADAEADCQNDGGHLIIINSPRKWAAFASLMNSYNYTDWVHVGGQRKDVNSPWTYALSIEDSGYTNWGPGQPSNTGSRVCLIARTLVTSSGLMDYPCGNSRFYVCEVSPVWNGSVAELCFMLWYHYMEKTFSWFVKCSCETGIYTDTIK